MSGARCLTGAAFISSPIIISIVAQKDIVIIGGLLHHLLVHHVIKLVFVVLVDVHTSLTHLGPLLVLILVAVSE